MTAPKPLLFTPKATAADIIADGPVQTGAQVYNTDTGKLQFTNDGSTFGSTATLADIAAAVASTMNLVLVTGTSIAMTDTSMTNRYILQNSAPCTLTLPATIAAGHSFEIVGGGSAGWIIAQNSGQTIQFGASITTTGVSGSLASTLQTDSLILSCTTANTQLTAYGVQGNISVV